MKKKILILISFLTPVLLVLFFSLQPVKTVKANTDFKYDFISWVEFDEGGWTTTWCCCLTTLGDVCSRPYGPWVCGGGKCLHK